jgi:hypothetical protein
MSSYPLRIPDRIHCTILFLEWKQLFLIDTDWTTTTQDTLAPFSLLFDIFLNFRFQRSSKITINQRCLLMNHFLLHFFKIDHLEIYLNTNFAEYFI